MRIPTVSKEEYETKQKLKINLRTSLIEIYNRKVLLSASRNGRDEKNI